MSTLHLMGHAERWFPAYPPTVNRVEHDHTGGFIRTTFGEPWWCQGAVSGVRFESGDGCRMRLLARGRDVMRNIIDTWNPVLGVSTYSPVTAQTNHLVFLAERTTEILAVPYDGCTSLTIPVSGPPRQVVFTDRELARGDCDAY